MKKILLVLFGMLIFMGNAHAVLITIGTADYDYDGDGTADIMDLNLIWDNDNNGNSVVWLDYTRSIDTQTNQAAWALSLEGSLTYSISSGYTVNWSEDNWRLPATVDGEWELGFDGTTTGGFNITSSEMGHLYHEELGNQYHDTNGVYVGAENSGLLNTGDFNNLVAEPAYWSDTVTAANGSAYWTFRMSDGKQGTTNYYRRYYGLAIRAGDVTIAPVPEPASILLLGSGLLVLAEVRRKNRE